MNVLIIKNIFSWYALHISYGVHILVTPEKMVHKCISYNYSSMYRTPSDNLVLMSFILQY